MPTYDLHYCEKDDEENISCELVGSFTDLGEAKTEAARIAEHRMTEPVFGWTHHETPSPWRYFMDISDKAFMVITRTSV